MLQAVFKLTDKIGIAEFLDQLHKLFVLYQREKLTGEDNEEIKEGSI